MMDTKQDNERKLRLHEWFKSSPEIWQDIAEEFRQAHRNETDKLKARSCDSREWSAGYVYGYGEVLEIERYYKKTWTPPTTKQK